MFKKKKLSLYDQVMRERAQLRRRRVVALIESIFVFIGVIGGISYLGNKDNLKSEVNQDVLYENIAIEYVRSYYTEEKNLAVDNIVITSLSGTSTKEVGINFELNNIEVATELTIDSDKNVINEIVLFTPLEKEEFEAVVTLDTVKALDDGQKDESKQFIESYFSSLNLGNGKLFFDKAPILNENTQYDLTTLEILDSGVTSENLIATYFSIDYIYVDEEGVEVFREEQDIQITYNSDSKIIEKIKY